MSVYLATKSSTNKDVPAAFLAKKLNNLVPAPISQLAIAGRPRFTEVAYGMYRQNIDAFVASTLKKEKLFAGAEGFGLIDCSTTSLPISHPPLVFSPNAKLNEDQASRLLVNLGKGVTMKKIGAVFEYTVEDAKYSNISKYLQIYNPNFSTGPGRISPLGYKAYFTVIALIEGFLATNYYPAFADLNTEIPKLSSMEFGTAGVCDDDKKAYFFSYQEGLKRDSDEVVDYHSCLKRRKLKEEQKEGDAMDVEQGEILKNEKLGKMSFEGDDLAASVIYAKPSGRPANVNYGQPGTVPRLPGLLFPYFKGMNRPDFTTMKEIVVDHFFRLLGKDTSECKTEMLELRRGLQNLSNSDAGMELTHIMKGIDLCLKTQTRLFLVFSKTKYEGFALLGGHFSIFDGTRWIEPVSNKDLKVELARMDTHANSIKMLADMMSGMKMKDGRKNVKLLPKEIEDSATLIKLMSIRDFEDFDQEEDFDRALTGLIWDKPYVQISPSTFIYFLEQYFVEIAPPTSDLPIYIPSCKAPVADRLFQWLGTFGPDAPSMWNSQGDRISVIPSEMQRGSKGKGKAEDLPAVPKELIIIPKPLLIALNDWKRSLSSGCISINTKERAKQYRTHVITASSTREKIWKLLQDGFASHDARETEAPVEKRRRIENAVVPEDMFKISFD